MTFPFLSCAVCVCARVRLCALVCRASHPPQAVRRDVELARLAAEAQRRKEAELCAEAAQRQRMGMEEAAQRSVDDFWGLPTKWAYFRRLEAYKAKIWVARMGDRRKRMIQVGEVLADSQEETAAVRAFSKEPWMRDWVQGTC